MLIILCHLLYNNVYRSNQSLICRLVGKGYKYLKYTKIFYLDTSDIIVIGHIYQKDYHIQN